MKKGEVSERIWQLNERTLCVICTLHKVLGGQYATYYWTSPVCHLSFYWPIELYCPINPYPRNLIAFLHRVDDASTRTASTH